MERFIQCEAGLDQPIVLAWTLILDQTLIDLHMKPKHSVNICIPRHDNIISNTTNRDTSSRSQVTTFMNLRMRMRTNGDQFNTYTTPRHGDQHACERARGWLIDGHRTCNAATRATSPAAPMGGSWGWMFNSVRVVFTCMQNRLETEQAAMTNEDKNECMN